VPVTVTNIQAAVTQTVTETAQITTTATETVRETATVTITQKLLISAG
jgi:hypothetical protein